MAKEYRVAKWPNDKIYYVQVRDPESDIDYQRQWQDPGHVFGAYERYKSRYHEQPLGRECNSLEDAKRAIEQEKILCEIDEEIEAEIRYNNTPQILYEDKGETLG